MGLRFTDESLGDEVSNQATLRQPGSRAVLLCDERIRAAFAVTAPYPHGQVIDRIAAAREAGRRYASARTNEELGDVVAGWGGGRQAPAATLEQEPLIDPPFPPLQVPPPITL